MKKKIMTLLICLGLLFTFVPTNISAASYDYGTTIASNGKTFTSYTVASNDTVSLSINAKYMYQDGRTLKDYAANKNMDPSTRMARLANVSYPTGGIYWTWVKGTHRVGNNTYYTERTYNS